MPFNAELIKPTKQMSEKFLNLKHEDDTIRSKFQDCYSHYGFTHNKQFDNYFIGINIPDSLYAKLKQVEAKATTFLSEEPAKPILRSLVVNDDRKILYLRLKSNQFDCF